MIYSELIEKHKTLTKAIRNKGFSTISKRNANNEN